MKSLAAAFALCCAVAIPYTAHASGCGFDGKDSCGFTTPAPAPAQTKRADTGCGFDGKDSCGFTTPARSEQVNAPPDQAGNTLASISAAIPLQLTYPNTNIVPGSAAAEASTTRCIMQADMSDLDAQVKCGRILAKWLYAHTPMLVGEADMVSVHFTTKVEARALRAPRGYEPIEFDSDDKRLIYGINRKCPKSLDTEAAFQCRDQIRDLPTDEQE
jgi:hypothetical protein